MARPVFHESLGQFFVSLREAKGWGQRQAASIAERNKLPGLTRQVMWRLEAGKTKNAEPDVLRSLALLYEVPYQDLVARWVKVRFGVTCTVTGEASKSEPVVRSKVDRELQKTVRLWGNLTTRERSHVLALMSDLVATRRGAGAKTA